MSTELHVFCQQKKRCFVDQMTGGSAWAGKTHFAPIGSASGDVPDNWAGHSESKRLKAKVFTAMQFAEGLCLARYTAQTGCPGCGLSLKVRN
jgi:hypothetical protein